MKRIKLSDGAGGEGMHSLIKEHVLKHLSADASELEVPLQALDDSAVIGDIVFTTDSHTVKPLFFPGGDIGSLAVAGTVNDLSVMGAKPLALSCGAIIEESLPLDDLDKILESMARTSKYAGVPVITGDTKVVEKGAADQLFINTSGVGKRSPYLDKNIQVIKEHRPFSERWMLDSNLRDGDAVIASGTIGDHGIALMSFREGYGFESEVVSDVQPLNKMIETGLSAGGIVAMKDPTRGGLANTLNEMSEKSNVGILVREENIPFNPGVISASEILGIDPLEVGNEGKAVICVVKEMAEAVLKAIRGTDEGKNAAIIGEVRKDLSRVVLETSVGGRRIMETPFGDPVPRIC